MLAILFVWPPWPLRAISRQSLASLSMIFERVLSLDSARDTATVLDCHLPPTHFSSVSWARCFSQGSILYSAGPACPAGDTWQRLGAVVTAPEAASVGRYEHLVDGAQGRPEQP